MCYLGHKLTLFSCSHKPVQTGLSCTPGDPVTYVIVTDSAHFQSNRYCQHPLSPDKSPSARCSQTVSWPHWYTLTLLAGASGCETASLLSMAVQTHVPTRRRAQVHVQTALVLCRKDEASSQGCQPPGQSIVDFAANEK